MFGILFVREADLNWWWLIVGCTVGKATSTSDTPMSGDSGPVVESGETGRAPDETACNGHPSLCARTLQQITLPGTHNSMSNADAGWLAPNQQHGITQQLEEGIRAMMLDTMEWNGEPYLCHGYCELGAQPLAEGLQEIEDFLAAHPREVLLIIFQDGLSVEVMVEVITEVGLSERVWTYGGESFPTLEEMIDAGQQLVVTAESGSPPPEWYQHAWNLITDTPYSFRSAEEFSCERLRGEEVSPLFLVNHWLGTPLPTEEGAIEVNRADILQTRAEECGLARDRPVNILAVDFYHQGDLFTVVDHLNGLTP